MKRKIIATGPDALKRIIKGANFAANTIKLTHGPYGRNFASGIRGGSIHSSNDGVSLARELVGVVDDEIEDIGVRAVCEGCIKTNDIAGDGTTTAAVLTQAVLSELDRKLGLSDGDIVGRRQPPAELIAQVNRECKEVVEMLKASARTIESKEDLVAIARVSGEYPDLADIIGGARWEVGRHGAVFSEEATSSEDSVEFIHGIRLDNGYTTSRIINNQARQSLDLEDVHVILTNKFFTGSLKQVRHILEKIAEQGAGNVLVMGRGFDDDAIGWCVKQIQESALKVFPVNAPYVDQNEVMEDLAAVLGGRYMNSGERNLETMILDDVGHASKVIFKRFEAIIAGYPEGKNVAVDERIGKRALQLEEKLQGELSPFERRLVESRLSQLRGGTALIKVGAETDQERKHKKDKVDDAVNAVQAAFEEGTVMGAGIALNDIANTLPDTFLIREALRAPYKQIRALAPADFTVEAWVRDPLKVVRVALEKACSIAGALATSEVGINWEREKLQYVTNVDNKIAEHEE